MAKHFEYQPLACHSERSPAPHGVYGEVKNLIFNDRHCIGCHSEGHSPEESRFLFSISKIFREGRILGTPYLTPSELSKLSPEFGLTTFFYLLLSLKIVKFFTAVQRIE
jgi:hypothetical protein